MPTSTSIFSAISASILKISVPINKRRSWRFQNTSRSHLSDEYWPRKQQKTKWHKNCFYKSINQTNFVKLQFSFNCNNLAQNNPNFASWGCFGIVRTSSWWWALRFSKSIHPGLRNWQKRKSSSYWRQLYFNICKVGDRQGVMMSQILYSTEECKAVKPWTESVSWT